VKVRHHWGWRPGLPVLILKLPDGFRFTAAFLAAEEHLVEARRRAIVEPEYRRCEELGRRALRRGQPVRSGRPLEAAIPGRR
jgi:hypothetical protein